MADQTPRRFYLSGRWARRSELADLAAQLEAATNRLAWTGWRSCAGWLEAPLDAPDLGPTDPHVKQAIAADGDLNDLRQADLVICITEANPTGDHVPASWARGGRHYEAGYAHANGIELWVIGPLENIFYALADEHWPVDVQVDDLAQSMVELAERLDEAEDIAPLPITTPPTQPDPHLNNNLGPGRNLGDGHYGRLLREPRR